MGTGGEGIAAYLFVAVEPFQNGCHKEVFFHTGRPIHFCIAHQKNEFRCTGTGGNDGRVFIQFQSLYRTVRVFLLPFRDHREVRGHLTGNGVPCFHVMGFRSVGFQVFGIHGDHGGEVAPRRTAGNIDHGGIPAVITDVFHHPGDSCRRIVDVIRTLCPVAGKTVVHRHDPDFLPVDMGRRTFFAEKQTSTVEPDQDREIFPVIGQIQIQLAAFFQVFQIAGFGCVGTVIRNVLEFFCGESERGKSERGEYSKCRKFCFHGVDPLLVTY